MSLRRCLFGGALLSAGLATPAHGAVTVNSVLSGFNVDSVAGDDVLQIFDQPGPLAPVIFAADGLSLNMEITPDRAFVHLDLDPSNADWNSAYVTLGGSFTSDETMTRTFSWDFGGWTQGRVRVRNVTLNQTLVDVMPSGGPTLGAFELSMNAGHLYNVDIVFSGPPFGGEAVFFLPLEKDILLAQPTDLDLGEGTPAMFSVEAFWPPATRYQWRRLGLAASDLVNGGRISGADGPSLLISPTVWQDAALYECVATIGLAQEVSDFVTLLITPAPVAILEHPQSVAGTAGAAAALTINAPAATSYQWRRDGAPIPGANGPTLAFTSLSDDDEGSYDCVVVVEGAEYTSEPAVIAVRACLPGDENGDGEVNFTDLNRVLSAFGASCPPPAR